MNSRRSLTRVAGWAAAGVVVAAAIGVGVAQAADPAPSTGGSPSASATPDPGNGTHGRPGRRAKLPRRGAFGAVGPAMHGELVVKGKDGKPATVKMQRGSVTAVSASSITLKSEDGFTGTYGIGSDTRVRIAEKGATATEIKTGDTATLTARTSGSATTATSITVRK